MDKFCRFVGTDKLTEFVGLSVLTNWHINVPITLSCGDVGDKYKRVEGLR